MNRDVIVAPWIMDKLCGALRRGARFPSIGTYRFSRGSRGDTADVTFPAGATVILVNKHEIHIRDPKGTYKLVRGKD